MKMTGHMMYGTYDFDQKQKKHPWIPIHPESLKDPFNRHIHFVLTLSDKKRVALSDARKFAKVTLIDTAYHHSSEHLRDIGPEPLEKSFDLKKFRDRIELRSHRPIKEILLDQTIIAGIGNIYADESLWRAGIHPGKRMQDIPPAKTSLLFKAIKQTLARGIDLGGDSMSDYRNIHGERGKFQEHHRAYRKTGEKCSKKGCKGIIVRTVVAGRGTHFCNVHQKQ